jgi:phenylpyruvate tautomerase PptA (4-oxalocrotonate tautomerase family)
MPMIDAFIPEGALNPTAEARLMEELTDILIRHEGLDPTNQRIRDVTWIFLHHPTIFRAGSPAPAPLYRVTPTVPEGQYDDAARAGLVREVTQAVARAEGGNFEEVSSRVWVFPTEILDGGWGSRGVVRRLPDIMGYFDGGPGRLIGEKRLAAKRRRDVVAFLEAALVAARSAPRAIAPDKGKALGEDDAA